MQVFLLSIAEVGRIPRDFCLAHFPERFRRSKGFLHEKDTLRCIGAGYLIWRILHVNEDALCCNEFGKPLLRAGNAHFSLSHSGDYVLLATDESEIGADIEALSTFDPAVADYAFTSAERAQMHAGGPDFFYRLWTMKEAVCKLAGCGLVVSPRSFCVLPLLSGQTIDFQGRPVYGQTAQWDGHILSVCSEHPLPPIVPQLLSATEF